MSRSMVKLITADGFFKPGDTEKLRMSFPDEMFVPTPYGREIVNFNHIYPKMEQMFFKVLGERVKIDQERSGIYRKPYNNSIHFEPFESAEEWCFFIALERTVLNVWNHISNSDLGDFSTTDAVTAFHGYNFNYNNPFEWKIQTTLVLEPNEGMFIRPWSFHSLEDGMVQYYRLLADTQYRILVMGLPESKKRSIAEKLSERMEDSVLIHSYEERKKVKDLRFEIMDDYERQAHRILTMARKMKNPFVIINMCTPSEELRERINPDILIWADDVEVTKFEPLNKLFETPLKYDFRAKDDTDQTIDQILNFMATNR